MALNSTTNTHVGVLVILAIIVTVSVGGAIISPVNVIPILGFAGVICASLFTLLKVETVANDTKDALDEATSETKTALDRATVKTKENRAKTDKKLTDIHTLVNSNSTRQLQISAVALRRVADLTQHPTDAQAAELAEAALAEHEKAQRIVDTSATEHAEVPNPDHVIGVLIEPGTEK